MRKKQRYFKKIIAVITIIVALTLCYFIYSIFAYQKIVNEGSVLADNQCLKVNPLIIEKKNRYIKSIQALKDNDPKAYEKETDAYLAASNKYITQQEAWLKSQKKYIDRWDFQYFSPPYVKEAAMAQFVSRAADVESTKLLIDAFEIKDLNKALSEEQGKKAIEQIKIRNAAEKKYDAIWDNPGKLDWRTRFIRIPQTKCPEENLDIPDVEELISPPTNSNSPLS